MVVMKVEWKAERSAKCVATLSVDDLVQSSVE